MSFIESKYKMNLFSHNTFNQKKLKINARSLLELYEQCFS